MSFYYSGQGLDNNLEYNSTAYRDAIVKYLITEFDKAEIKNPFKDHREAIMKKTLTVYANKEEFSKFMSKQKGTPYHTTFRKSLNSDLSKFLYTDGYKKNESDFEFVLGSIKDVEEIMKVEPKQEKINEIKKKDSKLKADKSEDKKSKQIVEIENQKEKKSKESEILENKPEPKEKKSVIDLSVNNSLKKINENKSSRSIKSENLNTPVSQRSRNLDRSVNKSENLPKILGSINSKNQNCEIIKNLENDIKESDFENENKNINHALEKREYEEFNEDDKDSENDYRDEIIEKASIPDSLRNKIKSYLSLYGVKGKKPDFQYELLSLVLKKKIKNSQRTMLQYALNHFVKTGPSVENLMILQRWQDKYFELFIKNKNFLIWYQFCELLFSVIITKPWFKAVNYWCVHELLKSNQDKKNCTHMNKVLILRGSSGIGKTSFARILIEPVFPILNIEVGEFKYQNPEFASDRIKVLISPDDASASEMYQFCQVIQGEVSIQIKKHNTPLNTQFKSGIIMTNIPKDKIFSDENIERDYGIQRLKRRTLFADLEDDQSLVNFLFGKHKNITEPPLLFRCYYFWEKILQTVDNPKFKNYLKQVQNQIIINPKEYPKNQVKTFNDCFKNQQREAALGKIRMILPDRYSKFSKNESQFLMN